MEPQQRAQEGERLVEPRVAALDVGEFVQQRVLVAARRCAGEPRTRHQQHGTHEPENRGADQTVQYPDARPAPTADFIGQALDGCVPSARRDDELDLPRQARAAPNPQYEQRPDHAEVSATQHGEQRGGWRAPGGIQRRDPEFGRHAERRVQAWRQEEAREREPPQHAQAFAPHAPRQAAIR